MTDFADVEQFVRQHAGCGGLSPSAVPRPAGGFLLTLTCTCGETFDRWVTAEEAKQPLPQIPIASRAAPAAPAPPATSPGPAAPSIPSAPPTPKPPPTPPKAPPPVAPPPPSRQAVERPRVAPSRELEEALRAALEAEAEPVARPTATPSPAKPVPRQDLDALMREALAAEEAAANAAAPPARPAALPAGAGPGSRPRSAVTRLDLDVTIRQALDRQRADAAEPREVDEPPVTRRVWISLVAVAVLGVASTAAYWYFTDSSDEDDAPSTPSAPRLPSEQRAALDEVVKSLRQLQASTPPDSTPSVYASRVLIAKGDVEKFAQSTAPAAARTTARELMDLHLLASSTLRARSLDRKDVFEVLARDPTLSLCPEVKGVLDRASQVGSLSPEDARAAAVSASVQKLQECARARLAALERMLAEQR
jgi:hypothetical protein